MVAPSGDHAGSLSLMPGAVVYAGVRMSVSAGSPAGTGSRTRSPRARCRSKETEPPSAVSALKASVVPSGEYAGWFSRRWTSGPEEVATEPWARRRAASCGPPCAGTSATSSLLSPPWRTAWRVNARWGSSTGSGGTRTSSVATAASLAAVGSTIPLVTSVRTACPPGSVTRRPTAKVIGCATGTVGPGGVHVRPAAVGVQAAGHDSSTASPAATAGSSIPSSVAQAGEGPWLVTVAVTVTGRPASTGPSVASSTATSDHGWYTGSSTAGEMPGRSPRRTVAGPPAAGTVSRAGGASPPSPTTVTEPESNAQAGARRNG